MILSRIAWGGGCRSFHCRVISANSINGALSPRMALSRNFILIFGDALLVVWPKESRESSGRAEIDSPRVRLGRFASRAGKYFVELLKRRFVQFKHQRAQ